VVLVSQQGKVTALDIGLYKGRYAGNEGLTGVWLGLGVSETLVQQSNWGVDLLMMYVSARLSEK
jgi:hypothetical protein